MTHVTQSAPAVTRDERAEAVGRELEDLEGFLEVLRRGRLPAEKRANVARLIASRAEVLARLYEGEPPEEELRGG